jgi:hypothetical protein
MKKGSYWFSFLSEKEQKEFRENVKKVDDNFTELMNKEYSSFEFFISTSFLYSGTAQGFSYWVEISNRKVQ